MFFFVHTVFGKHALHIENSMNVSKNHNKRLFRNSEYGISVGMKEEKKTLEFVENLTSIG